MTKLPSHTMAIGDVARVLGVGPDRVRQLDDKLRPIRLPTGARRYDPRLVQREADRRAVRAG